MRALQMDPVNGWEPHFVNTKNQNCFCMCTCATVAQVLISTVVTPVLLGIADTKQNVEGDLVMEWQTKLWKHS